MKRLALVLALLLWPGAARADFAAGLAAYDGGDYATAFAEWRRLAEEGDAEAQAALAGLYRHGQGAPADPREAARWYRRAAEQGHASARLNLGEMYASGEGVAADRVEASAWLGLAALQGSAWALLRRDELLRTMTADERSLARALLHRRLGNGD